MFRRALNLAGGGGSGNGNAAATTASSSSSPNASQAESVQSRIGRVFDALRAEAWEGEDAASAPTADRFGPQGVGHFIERLGLDPETDVEALVVLFKCKAKSMYDLTRDEFVHGLMEVGVASVEDLKAMLPEVAEEVLGDAAEFKAFYKYVFQSARDGQARVIPKELAIGLWPIVLRTGHSEEERSKHVDPFCAWLAANAQVKQINADQWNSFLEFNLRVKADLSNFAEEQSWCPVLFEDYVQAQIKAKAASGV